MDNEYVGVDRASRMLGVSKRAVRNMAAHGELEVGGEGAAGRLVVSLASVERALSKRRAARTSAGGRPAFS